MSGIQASTFWWKSPLKQAFLYAFDDAGPATVDTSAYNTDASSLNIAGAKYGARCSSGASGGGVNATIPNNPQVALGRKDFTLEMWAKSSGTAAKNIFRHSEPGAYPVAVPNAYKQFEITTETSDRITLYTYDNSGNYFGYTTPAGSFLPNVWNHICLERYLSVMTFYINGVAQVTSAMTYTVGLPSGSYDYPMVIGSNTVLIDDLSLITGGARYKGAFIPPASALSSI